jgi:hypothetical protein
MEHAVQTQGHAEGVFVNITWADEAMLRVKVAAQAKRGGGRCRSSGLDAAGNIELATALETVVGARVGVWWDEDETYYRVRLLHSPNVHAWLVNPQECCTSAA